MTYQVDETHDPKLTSWIESANDAKTDFPIQNLPFCTFRTKTASQPRPGVAIGDQIVDLLRCAEEGMLSGAAANAVRAVDLRPIMALSVADRSELRSTLSRGLRDQNSAFCSKRSSILVAQGAVELLLPCAIGDYTDFYASIFHATNVGSMLRPDNPLLPNYKHIPIGYHGRASSIVVSGTPFRRPTGQLPPAENESQPAFGPCKNLDYELELGVFVGSGNEMGSPIAIRNAEDHYFGMCLLNDWSARDMQRWEYQPLGPFLAKSFATSISPFVVTMEALAPFRVPAMARPVSDPRPLPYLWDDTNQSAGGVDVQLSVYLSTAQMREQKIPAVQISQGSFTSMYWTIAQMLTHHSSNGCNLRTGDLLGSGTVSGPERGSRGCLLELTWDGEYGRPVPGSQRTPLEMPTGEKRTFLADGDLVSIHGFCQREGYRKIGFGRCDGAVLPSV
jgi:fumarylacetoacetase